MKQNIVLGLTLVLTVFVFLGGAIYIVRQGVNERDNICAEVQALRDDIVEVLDLAAAERKRQGLPTTEASKKAYTIIRTPSC